MKAFIKNGRLTLLSEVLLAAVVLLGTIGVPYLGIPLWGAIPIWGLTCVAIGLLMYEGRASALGLKPFTNDPLGWRKAKKGYKQESVPKSENPEKR